MVAMSQWASGQWWPCHSRHRGHGVVAALEVRAALHRPEQPPVLWLFIHLNAFKQVSGDTDMFSKGAVGWAPYQLLLGL